MLSRHRRYFAALTLGLLAAPLVWGLFAPDSPDLIYKEGRRLAPAPGRPADLAALRAFPAQVDAYLRDHFGLRHAMIKLHKDLTHPVLFKVDKSVLVGRDGRLFFEGNEAVRQSAGIVFRDARVAEAADMAAQMRDELAKRGAKFLVTVPPNVSTIYQDDLPDWAQRKGRKTEYDLFVQDLAARGVKTVDLRPAMTALSEHGQAYLFHDTHWTPRGAIEGFNTVVEADGHPDWRIDPATAIGPPAPQKGGDAARMLGVEDQVSEMVDTLTLQKIGDDHALTDDFMPDHVVTTGKAGPTIVVVGDSFTTTYFPLFLSPHVGKAIWLRAHGCAFDWKEVESFHPDEVWYAPTERFLVCEPGRWPANLPGKQS